VGAATARPPPQARRRATVTGTDSEARARFSSLSLGVTVTVQVWDGRRAAAVGPGLCASDAAATLNPAFKLLEPWHN
jgi:hypothetical protein